MEDLIHILINMGGPQFEEEPKWQATSVGQAVHLFPDKVFTRWLRFRRSAADRWHSDWREHPRKEQVLLLDECALFQASLN